MSHDSCLTGPIYNCYPSHKVGVPPQQRQSNPKSHIHVFANCNSKISAVIDSLSLYSYIRGGGKHLLYLGCRAPRICFTVQNESTDPAKMSSPEIGSNRSENSHTIIFVLSKQCAMILEGADKQCVLVDSGVRTKSGSSALKQRTYFFFKLRATRHHKQMYRLLSTDVSR